jgi:hypothetical protein
MELKRPSLTIAPVTRTLKLSPPVILSTETKEEINEVMELIDEAKEPNQVQVMASPSFARAVIERQVSFQRGLNIRTVEQLQSDIDNSEFVFTGDSIKFAVGGRGIDGQHRCEALARSTKSIQILLVMGLPERSIEKMDLGRLRTVGDIHNTRVDGNRVKPTGEMTAAIGLECQDFDKKKVSGMSKTARVAADTKLPESQMIFLGDMSKSLHRGDIRTTGALAGALRAYVMFPEHQDLIAKFLAATFSNQPAAPDFDLVLSSELYNYLNKTKAAQGSTQSATYNQAVAVIKTVRALVDGVTLSLRTATPREIAGLKRGA